MSDQEQGLEPPNYTQLPNALFKLMPLMSEAELRVVLVIARQTFGWHKESDELSISQLMEKTGMSNRAVINGVQRGIERGIIKRTPIDEDNIREGFMFSLLVNESHKACEPKSQPLMNKVHTQKKRKESIKENGVTEPAPETPAPPPSVHVTAAAIANDETLETSLLGLLERINGAIRKKKSDARIITGTKVLARKLAQRGETADTVKAAWLTCKQNGDSPVGAFVFWVNQEYLPPPRKGHETQADAQGNQQVWVEGQGWMDTGRAA